MVWSENRSQWQRAVAQPTGRPIVACVHPRNADAKPGYVVFDDGTTAAQIDATLHAAKWTPGAETWLTSEGLGVDPWVASPPGTILDKETFRSNELAYVWDSAKLYSRAELTRGFKAKTLPSVVTNALFQSPPSFSGLYVTDEYIVGPLGVILFLLGAVIAASLPWLLFMLLRWLAKGFAAS